MPQPLNDLRLADVRAVFGRREIDAFGLEAADNARVTWNRAITLAEILSVGGSPCFPSVIFKLVLCRAAAGSYLDLAFATF